MKFIHFLPVANLRGWLGYLSFKTGHLMHIFGIFFYQSVTVVLHPFYRVVKL